MFATNRIYTVMRLGIRMKHSLPELPYELNALEPIISREIMFLHHQKHHATYINNFNAAEEKLALATSKSDINTIISLAPVLRFNGGGHINHTIFWKNLSPNGGEPSKELCAAINTCFGSFDNMKTQLSNAAVGIQGSGWGWLSYNKTSKRLQIATCSNQDPLEGTTGLIPLFGIDVWEHAYYLQYKNVRADYVKAIFEIANWCDISERFAKASC
uniref:Superoxide dismutase n=1 Tax=Protohermes xanthodes TaxID=1452977 RepID=A0AA96R1P7_9NEOP|nr:manganese superoxide dismutase 2 [Protohermes xanthodes]